MKIRWWLLLPLLSALLFTACGAGQGTREEFLFAMGNSDVPVGEYTSRILSYYGIDESAAADHITYGSNVKEVVSAIVEGTADCGVIYETDAAAAGLTPVARAEEAQCGKVVYPAAVLKAAKNPAAKHFLEYLTGEEAASVFEVIGFTPMERREFAPSAGDTGEITVFAASSLTESLTELGRRYEALVPGVTLVFQFDSSGTLKTQIEEGADCDLFLSASQKHMDALAELVDPTSRVDLLENKVVLCVAESSPVSVDSFDRLAELLQR